MKSEAMQGAQQLLGAKLEKLELKGNEMKGGFGNMMKQAAQMQQNLQRVQAEMATKTADGTAGGGMVKNRQRQPRNHLDHHQQRSGQSR